MPWQTVQKKEKAAELGETNLCYCVPEFSNLDLSGLPDTSEILEALQAKLEGSNSVSLRRPFDSQYCEEAKHDFSVV